MMSHFNLISLLVGMFLSIVLPTLVFFNRSRVYAAWAKITSVIVCMVGLGWGFLGLMLSHSEISGKDYSRLDGIKGMLGGICIGLVLGIMIARPYQKVVFDKSEKTPGHGDR